MARISTANIERQNVDKLCGQRILGNMIETKIENDYVYYRYEVSFHNDGMFKN